ncbi:MAG: N-acetylmuramoyl-L-alanine amidase, partial [Actinomycetota bacterium]|nr:N-acetylmuramoyl-L-alanine amidase [Actinomycetota bacterium]
MDRRGFLRLGGTGLAGAILLGTASEGSGRALAQIGPSLAAEFEAAAKEYGVPKELLLAVGYVNTLWEMPPPDASPYEPDDLHGRGAYGIMQLVRRPSKDTLGRAASLTGLAEEKLKTSRAANVRGGAAVLADMAGGERPSGLDGWYDIVAGYGSGPLYANEVYGALQRGASAKISTGERLELAPQP